MRPWGQVNFSNRFYTNKESAKAVAKLMDEEEAREEQEAEKAGGLNPGKIHMDPKKSWA